MHGYQGDGAHAVEAFARAAGIHRRLSELDPKNKGYRFLRGEVLLRSANWVVTLGRRDDARAAAAERLTPLVVLASVPSPSLTHVFGACRWLTETEVQALRREARRRVLPAEAPGQAKSHQGVDMEAPLARYRGQ